MSYKTDVVFWLLYIFLDLTLPEEGTAVDSKFILSANSFIGPVAGVHGSPLIIELSNVHCDICVHFVQEFEGNLWRKQFDVNVGEIVPKSKKEEKYVQ